MTVEPASRSLETLARTRADLRAEAQQIIDRAKAEQRDLSRGEETRVSEIVGDLRRLDDREADLQRRQANADAITGAFESRGITPAGPGNGPGSKAYDEDQHLRSMLFDRDPRPLLVHHERRGLHQPGIELRQRRAGVESRDILSSTGNVGSLRPTNIYNRVFELLVESTAVLKAGATVISTDDGAPLNIPKTTAQATPTLVSEGQALPEADPTLNYTGLGAYKAGILLQLSSEIAADAGIDLVEYVSGLLARSLWTVMSPYFVSGNGSSQPRGLLTDSTLGLTGPTGATGGFGAQATAGQGTDNLLSLVGSVNSEYQASPAAAFLSRGGTLQTVKSIKTSAGDPVGVDFVNNVGFPWFIDPNVPAIALSAKSVIFGDISKYVVRFAGPLRVERSDEYAFGSDLISLRAVQRFDASLCDLSGAVKYFQGAGT